MKETIWLVENWYLVVGLMAVCGLMGVMIGRFLKLPTKEQIAQVKEWLLWACVEAEKELGNGTGQLKLRYVYDLFVTRFPTLVKMVPFATFSLWVESALEEMRKMLTQNQAVRAMVKGE